VWLTRAVGWQGALQVLGALIIVVALPLALVVKEHPPSPQPYPEPRFNRSRSPCARVFICSSSAACARSPRWEARNQHLKLFLSLDHGYSQAGAARIASLVLASSLVGRLGAGWLADRFAKKYVMLLIYLLVVSAIPLLLLTGARGTIYLFAVVFGLGLGGEYMVIPLMAGELFGERVLGRTMGVV